MLPKTRIQKEANLEGVEHINAAMRNGEFSIGELAKKLKWPFQKVRHFCRQIA